MKLMEKNIQRLLRCIFTQQSRPDLVSMVSNSAREWKISQNHFNFVDPELIDYMVYRLSATERHYMALLAQARQSGVKAWPDDIKPEVRELAL